MSNEEKKRRALYKLQRKRWIVLQLIIILIVSIFSAYTGYLYFERSQTFYISYNEKSSVDYKVQLIENEFYEDGWLDSNQAYVASLIKEVKANFNYELETETSNVDYEYSYDVVANLLVKENRQNMAMLDREYKIKSIPSTTQNTSNKLKISEEVIIDYDYYRTIADHFVTLYELTSTTSVLVLKTKISVRSTCEDATSSSHSNYEVSLTIPLSSQALYVEMSSTVPTGATKLLACESKLDTLKVKVLTFVGCSLDIALIIVLICYMLLTRNTDINYENKIKKILNNYKSYIQKINNTFNTEGYQILEVNTFEEMLEIRDTIQEPVLMNENEDKTCTTFYIPTDKGIVYIYQIKVDDYDEIYDNEEFQVVECN